MRGLFTSEVVLAAALAAPLASHLDDETCVLDWVNPAEHHSSFSGAVVSGTSTTHGGDVAVRQKSAIVASADTSTISMPTRPDGSAGLPVNNDHLSAPTDTGPVPHGAAIYTPSGNTINCIELNELNSWMTRHRNRRSRFKVPQSSTRNLQLRSRRRPCPRRRRKSVPRQQHHSWLFSGSSTHNLRNVTFLIPITPENANRRPADMIYVDESDDPTIFGGTVRIDQDEPSSQARLTPSPSGPRRATSTVEKGRYNVRARAAAGPRNQGCVDTSPPTHFTRPPCNS